MARLKEWKEQRTQHVYGEFGPGYDYQYTVHYRQVEFDSIEERTEYLNKVRVVLKWCDSKYTQDIESWKQQLASALEKRAAEREQIDIDYQEKCAAVRALPWWKRVFSHVPERQKQDTVVPRKPVMSELHNNLLSYPKTVALMYEPVEEDTYLAVIITYDNIVAPCSKHAYAGDAS